MSSGARPMIFSSCNGTLGVRISGWLGPSTGLIAGRAGAMPLTFTCDLSSLSKRAPISSSETRWLHLKPFFADLRATGITKDTLTAYVDSRLTENASRASINREMAALRRMLRLAAEKLPKLPTFPQKLAERKRTGFLNDEELAAITANATELWLRTFIEIGGTLGWRRGEILGLRVKYVDLKRKLLRIDTSKNGHARECPMTEKICQLVKECIAAKSYEDFVLTRSGNRPVRDFRAAFSRLCEKIGRPELIVHDFRRTAARNLRRVGNSENTIMAIGGWETNSVFKRYDIQDNCDKGRALEKLEQERAIATAKSEA